MTELRISVDKLDEKATILEKVICATADQLKLSQFDVCAATTLVLFMEIKNMPVSTKTNVVRNLIIELGRFIDPESNVRN